MSICKYSIPVVPLPDDAFINHVCFYRVLNNKVVEKNFRRFYHFRVDDEYKGRLPVVTLYTHGHCSLCDDLVEELEVKFNGRYQLEKVDITSKENLKYLRLYRLDIPVCFVNGQFLCKHKLNCDLLEKRLKDLSK